MNKYLERVYNGLIKENPTFVLMLGMCPTLAVTTSAMNALGMGLSTTVVLIFSNLLISLFRKAIPNGVRMPAYIVIVASLVTIVEFIMKAYTPALAKQLGVYIPLIVVNCIILGRAESYASKNPPVLSILDGVGMGLGFTFGLTCIGIVREILGAGQLFGFQILLTEMVYTNQYLCYGTGCILGTGILSCFNEYCSSEDGSKRQTTGRACRLYQWRLCRMQHVCNLQRKREESCRCRGKK
ncbi:MAG: electron transport complex subunit RsxE [Roseburia sp.]